MSDNETTLRIAICYITGKIKSATEPKTLEVSVDNHPVQVRGDGPGTWKYLGIVEKGNHNIAVTLDERKQERTVDVQMGTVTEDFIFTSD